MASDADGIANSVITYSIIDGNPDGNFLIGLRDGVIQIATPVDRELVTSLFFFTYFFLLPACDCNEVLNFNIKGFKSMIMLLVDMHD